MLLQHITLANPTSANKPWKAELSFTQAVLLVGRNSTGKSRILSGLGTLGRLLTGRQNPTDGHFEARFLHREQEILYTLHTEKGRVLKEEFRVEKQVLLERGAEGRGWIRAVEAGVERLSFRVNPTDVAALAKRDLIQHPFLEPLHEWAESLRYYRFNELRRYQFALLGNQGVSVPDNATDPSDSNQAVALFHAATQRHGDTVARQLVEDLNALGYRVSDVGLEPMDQPANTAVVQTERVYGLSIQEEDLPARTRQTEMSDGLFRALSLLIHTAYAELESRPSCIIIDDIGEGLDYGRSTALIQLLLQKADAKSIQLIMSTNDRFVMNAVPLGAWCGLKRTPTGVETICQSSHPDLFEDFKLTGLNNFDFFTMDFFEQPLGDTDMEPLP